MDKYTPGMWFYSGDLPHANPKETHSFWKITGPSRQILGVRSYPVIRCSSWGKEFKKTNGFTVSSVDAIPELRMFRPTCKNDSLGSKAAIDNGIKAGIKKRRIAFLEKHIAEDEKELADLKKWLKEHGA